MKAFTSLNHKQTGNKQNGSNARVFYLAFPKEIISAFHWRHFTN